MLGMGWHRGRMGGGPTLWNYLRVRALTTNFASAPNNVPTASYFNATEVQFRASVGGPALTGTASASSSFNASLLPANAFDGNPSTIWASAADFMPVGGRWLKLALSTPSDCQQVVFTADGSTANPGVMVVEGSLDNVTWTLLWGEVSIVPFTANETKTFTRSPVKELVICWRILCTTTWLDGFLACAEQAWNATPGGADIGGNAIWGRHILGNTWLPRFSRDGDNATFATTSSAVEPGGNWCGIATHNQAAPQELVYRVRPDGFREDPRASLVQRSDDGALTWVTTKDLGEIPAWAAGQSRTFDLT